MSKFGDDLTSSERAHEYKLNRVRIEMLAVVVTELGVLEVKLPLKALDNLAHELAQTASDCYE